MLWYLCDIQTLDHDEHECIFFLLQEFWRSDELARTVAAHFSPSLLFVWQEDKMCWAFSPQSGRSGQQTQTRINTQRRTREQQPCNVKTSCSCQRFLIYISCQMKSRKTWPSWWITTQRTQASAVTDMNIQVYQRDSLAEERTSHAAEIIKKQKTYINQFIYELSVWRLT